MQLFEQTGQVVYSVGDVVGNTAMTCQARPQDGEIFGEFPPRKDLFKYTKFPMVIPSAPASYNSHYKKEYLQGLATTHHMGGEKKSLPSISLPSISLPSIFDGVQSLERKGYLIALCNYLKDAANGPKEGWRNGLDDARTCLYGLQRPPLNNQPTLLRCNAETSLDDLAPILLPFVVTNACEQVRVSVHPKNVVVLAALENNKQNIIVDIEENFEEREKKDRDNWYNLVHVEPMLDDGYPLVAQWVSLWFPLGHIKSTKSNDQEFLRLFEKSDKWLRFC